MRIGRTLAPSAAPISLLDIVHGVAGLFNPQKALSQFTESIKSYFGVKYCFPVSSGKTALYITLQYLKKKYPDKDEVIIPSFTCFSLPSVITCVGLKVRICDISLDTLDYDFEDLKQVISESDSILAIIAPHLFGIPSDIKKVRECIGKKEIFLIEDAAQAMGTEIDGVKLGTQGDVGFFSLGRGKAFSTYEGGFVLVSNKLVGEGIQKEWESLPSYSITNVISLFIKTLAYCLLIHPLLFWIPMSLPFLKFGLTAFEEHFFNAKMTGFQAGLGWNWKRKVGEFIGKRIKNVQMWDHRKSEVKYSERLFTMPEVPLVRLPLLLKNEIDSKKIMHQSKISGLGISVTYSLVSNLPQINFANDPDQHSRNGAACEKRLLALPVNPLVLSLDCKRIINAFNRKI